MSRKRQGARKTHGTEHSSEARSNRVFAAGGAIRAERRIAGQDPAHVGLLLVCALVFFAAYLKIDRVLYGSDVTLSFYYYYDYSYRMLRQLSWPLWNPYIFSGTPYFPSTHGLYYPLHYLFIWLPTAPAMNLNLILHFFLAGAFCYFFLRSVDLAPGFSLLGGLVFMFPVIEILLVYGGHIPQLESRVWIPFIFWMFSSFLKTHGPRPLLLGALGIACQVFTGHLQIVFYTLFFLAIYFVYLTFSADRTKLLGNACRFGIFVLAGLSLSAVQLLPTISWVSSAGRSQSYEFATSFSLPPLSLVTAFVPFLFGDMVNVPYFGPSLFIWEANLFFGLIPAALIMVSLLHKPRGFTLFCVLMAVICVVLALGKYTPIYKLLYYAVPGYSYFRAPRRILSVFCFFAAILTALGSKAVVEKLGGEPLAAARRHLGFLLALLTSLTILSLILAFSSAERKWLTDLVSGLLSNAPFFARIPERTASSVVAEIVTHMGKQLGFAALGVALFIGSMVLMIARVVPWKRAAWLWAVLVLAEQGFYGHRFIKTIELDAFKWEPSIERLLEKEKEAGGQNLFRISDSRSPYNLDRGMLYGVSSVNGYEAAVLSRYGDFINTSQGELKSIYLAVLELRRYHPMLDLLNLKYLFLNSDDGFNSGRFQLIYRDPKLAIFEHRNPLPRIWVAHDTLLETDSDRILETISKGGLDFRKTVLLEDPAAPKPKPRGAISDLNGARFANESVNIVSYSANRIGVKANLDREGYLVFSEIHYPGWYARVDGKPAVVYRANYLLRAVHLTPGNHTVEMSFVPELFAPGLTVSLMTLLGLVLLLIYPRSRLAPAPLRSYSSGDPGTA
ncbi:MAG: YfhO family protein [Deltaproteobacteria bacterium]|nr:YfhO family protein [Deltaproteobacteria bacterium]